ncbi:MAG: hypothetical protein IAE95_04360 [Chitinophagaceae bacterium]|nr:hypothetical protein [Chitinophagaceae bacterium]
MITIANKFGFSAMAIETTIERLLMYKPFPCILFWRRSHFAVLLIEVGERFLSLTLTK